MTIQDDITAQTLKTVKQVQDFTLTAVNAFTDRVAPLLPKFDTDKLPKFAGLENLKPVDVVEKAFDLTSVLLASARTVAVDAAKAISFDTTPAAKPVAAAPVAKKTTVKKTSVAAA